MKSTNKWKGTLGTQGIPILGSVKTVLFFFYDRNISDYGYKIGSGIEGQTPLK